MPVGVAMRERMQHPVVLDALFEVPPLLEIVLELGKRSVDLVSGASESSGEEAG